METFQGTRFRGLGLTLATCGAIGFCGCAAATPESKALAVERLQCDDSTTETDLALVESAAVLSVEPIYGYMSNATTGTDRRLGGVKLLIRPPEAISAERTLRILQCHSARMFLGRGDRSKVDPNEPYSLEGQWLDIKLASESGNFAVTIDADDIRKNLQVLARARAFAATHARTGLTRKPPVDGPTTLR